MGAMKRMYMEMQYRARRPVVTDDELAEMALDLDAMNLLDADWWRHQDRELIQRELEEIESQAEIEDERMNGYVF